MQPTLTTPLMPAAVETVDECAARAQLRDQIGRLEWELGELVASGAATPAAAARPRAGSRLLSLADLEQLRDGLTARAATMRQALDARGRAEEASRLRLEELLRDPAAHRFVRISREEVGERGCGGWESRPRFGILGILMGWWRVKISSGCPLPGLTEHHVAAARRVGGARRTALVQARRLHDAVLPPLERDDHVAVAPAVDHP